MAGNTLYVIVKSIALIVQAIKDALKKKEEEKKIEENESMKNEEKNPKDDKFEPIIMHPMDEMYEDGQDDEKSKPKELAKKGVEEQKNGGEGEENVKENPPKETLEFIHMNPVD